MRVMLLALLLLQGPVPVEQEPRHKVQYADAAMRVLNVDIPPGETTLEHTHRNDIATVCVECGPRRNRVLGGEWGNVLTREVGTVEVTPYAANPGTHSVRAVGSEPYHLIAVENLRPGTWNGAPLAGLTPEKETAAFRVYRIAPGAPAPHTHRAPTVIVTVAAKRWNVIPPSESHTPASSTVEIELK